MKQKEERPPFPFALPFSLRPTKWGEGAPQAADEGLFLREARWQTRRRSVVQSKLRQPKSPSSAPPGHLLPGEGRGEGKMGDFNAVAWRVLAPAVGFHHEGSWKYRSASNTTTKPPASAR
jgi:hypothetical protein